MIVQRGSASGAGIELSGLATAGSELPKEHCDPDLSLSVMKRHGDPPTPLYDDRDLEHELVDLEWLLFVPVHEPLVADTALCIDGRQRNAEDFDIADGAHYCFVVQVRDGQVSLRPALLDGTSGKVPSLDLQARCGVLDEAMKAFARRFIRGE